MPRVAPSNQRAFSKFHGQSAYITARSFKGKKRNQKNALVKLIKRVNISQQEHKFNCGGAGSPVYFNASISSSGEFYGLIPPIPTGTGQGARVGDSIRPVSLIVKVLIAANGSLDSANVNMMRLFILSNKLVNNQTLGSNLAYNQLLDSGFGGPTSYDGTCYNHLYPVNKELWTVHVDKIKKFESGAGTTPTSHAAGTQTSIPPTQQYQLTFKVPLPNVLKYNLSTDTLPTNAARWLAIGYTQPDNNTAPDYLRQRLVCTWQVKLTYTDA